MKTPISNDASVDVIDGLPRERRVLAIITVVLALAMAVMDGSIANLALPAIGAEMHATDSEAIWIINSYQIAMAVCLLPLASLGEVVGYRRIYLVGLVMFTVASLACVLSNSMLQLSLARMLQGVGAAGILSVNTALVRFIYPQRLLGRAIGYNAMVAGAASALGPTVAGIILHFLSWHGLFLINIPIGLLALAIGYHALPFNPLSKRRYDLTSAALCMLFVGLLLYTFDAVGHRQAWLIPAVCGAAMAATLVLLLRQQSAQAPMLPVDLLRNPVFGLSICTSFCSFAAQTAAFVMLPFMLHNQLHLTIAQAGLVLTAWPAAIALTGPIAGRLSDAVPGGLLGGVGLAVLTLGLLSLLGIQNDTPLSVMALQLAVCGFGFGLFQAPNNRLLISAAPRSRSGAASGMLGTGRLIGQTIGASVVALVLASSSRPYPLVLAIAAGLSGLACLVSLSRLRYSPSSSAAHIDG